MHGSAYRPPRVAVCGGTIHGVPLADLALNSGDFMSRRTNRITAVAAGLLLSVGAVSSVSAAPSAGLYGCGASKTSSTSGHSYCSSGGTSGEQRVLLYCHEYWDPSDIYFVYGPWVVAKNWSAASCHAGDTADQASYVTSP